MIEITQQDTKPEDCEHDFDYANAKYVPSTDPRTGEPVTICTALCKKCGTSTTKCLSE
jgi:hypothetical protein